MLYKKRPHAVEATQWFPGVEIAGAPIVRQHNGESGLTLKLKTLEGVMLGNAGDWVVGPGVANEYWIVREDVFKQTYELVPLTSEGT